MSSRGSSSKNVNISITEKLKQSIKTSQPALVTTKKLNKTSVVELLQDNMGLPIRNIQIEPYSKVKRNVINLDATKIDNTLDVQIQSAVNKINKGYGQSSTKLRYEPNGRNIMSIILDNG